MNFSIDIKSVLLILTLAINITCGLIVYLRNRSQKVNRSFFILTLITSLWIASKIAYRGFGDYDSAYISCLILYFAAALIPPYFLYFVLVLTKSELANKAFVKFFISLSVVPIAVISLAPGLLIQYISLLSTPEKYAQYNIWLHSVYAIYIIGYFIVTEVILIRYYRSQHSDHKAQLYYVILGTLIASTIGVMCNLILPYFEIFTLNWFGEIGLLGMMIPISYSIVRYKLFDVKVVIAEVLVYMVWAALLVRSFVSPVGNEQALNFLVLLFSLLIGTILILTVRKEVKLREQISELDNQKSQLLSIATHDISNPLTVIKGYISFLEEGMYDDDAAKQKQVLGTIQQSLTKMTAILNDFIYIRRMKPGDGAEHKNPDISPN